MDTLSPSGFTLLPAFASIYETEVLAAIEATAKAAPFRHMQTRRGFRMSVAMTNCGRYGWLSDRTGYRYTEVDPLTEQPWPAMPEVFADLATEAAAHAGFEGFAPDACLINRYHVGARLSLHQDKNEQDFSQPIVSVSLGLPATFQFGGKNRADKVQPLLVTHTDILVWGGKQRLYYHGVLPLKPGSHPQLGEQRINLTLRKAG